MKHYLGIAMLAGTVAAAFSSQADNATVENALKSRPELSVFYNGLISTGVIHELSPNQPYTVFAPTNDAFARISQDTYPCFYSVTCKGQVAEVLRRHIVPGEKHLRDMNAEGGVYSLFSLDNQHVVGAQPNKDSFTVDDQKVLNENQLLGGELYEIGGVMIQSNELAAFVAPTVVVTAAAPQPAPEIPRTKVIVETTSDATTPIPY